MVIEALQFVGGHVSMLECASFVGSSAILNMGTAELGIQTLEGTMWATPGDWIIRGVKGEHYPCKPDIFAVLYEQVE